MLSPGSSAWLPPPRHLILEGGEVHVWRAELNLPGALFPGLRALLSAEEQEKAARFYFERDRRRYIAAHAALRCLLARYLQVEPLSICFLTGKYGKPALDPAVHPGGLFFNLSHSEELAIFAFARDLEIGIDIEVIRPLDDLFSLARANFAPGEYAALSSAPPRLALEAFFNGWTRKEALLKATGGGLSLPLDGFEVSLIPGEPARLVSCAPNLPLDGPWRLDPLQPAYGYIAALAVPCENFHLECYLFHP